MKAKRGYGNEVLRLREERKELNLLVFNERKAVTFANHDYSSKALNNLARIVEIDNRLMEIAVEGSIGKSWLEESRRNSYIVKLYPYTLEQLKEAAKVSQMDVDQIDNKRDLVYTIIQYLENRDSSSK